MPDRRPRSQIASNLYVAYDFDDLATAGAPSTKCLIGMKFQPSIPGTLILRETAETAYISID